MSDLDSLIPIEIRRRIIEQEMAQIRNGLYMLGLRYKVNKRLGNTEALASLEDESVKTQAMLDEYEKELAMLVNVDGEHKTERVKT